MRGDGELLLEDRAPAATAAMGMGE